MRSLEAPKRVVMRSRMRRAEASSPVRSAARRRFSWMVHVEGVSRVKRRERGQGRGEVGVVERMRGAFWERARAVWGGMREGGWRREGGGIVAVCGRRWARWVGGRGYDDDDGRKTWSGAELGRAGVGGRMDVECS